MLGLKRWHSRHVILCCGLLFLATGCGLSEMFGGSNAEKITEPCIELIPSATPTPIPTVVPIFPVTPQPGKTPTPSQSCGNAPGIVLICDGEPVEDTPITVITPTPPPVTKSFTLHLELTTQNSTGCPSAAYIVTPPGTAIPHAGYNTTVASGQTKTFVISPSIPMVCTNMSIYIDPVSVPVSSSVSGSTYTVTVGPVTQNIPLLSVYFYEP